MIRLFGAAVMLGIQMVAGTAGAAGPAEVANLTADDRSAIERVEKYLNGIETMKSRFIQVSTSGDYAEGQVFLDRPGRLRLEYDAPNPALLIADGQTLLYYDRQLKEATFIPLWETPLWFLLRDKVSLSDGVQVMDVEHDKGALNLTLRQADAPERGVLTLTFSDRPLALKKWSISDPQGIETQVALVDPRFGVDISPQLFRRDGLEYGPSGRPSR